MMQQLTRGQIEICVLQAGFTGDDAETAVAIALAESGGDPAAYNPELKANPAPGMGSIGLFQIYRWDHPEFCAWDLTDPLLNARAAYFIYHKNGKSFRGQWSTFDSGAYKNFLQSALPVAGGAE